MNDASSSEATVPEESLTDHAYDGIQEYDNPMPRWWRWTFWATFYFAICYFLWHNVFMNGTPITEEYAADMRSFREQVAKKEMGVGVSEEALARLMTNPALVADSQAVFKNKCVQCHGQDGQGVIGPNLTDAYWIHGQGKLMDVYNVINEGVTAKGMPAWGRQLAPVEVAKLAAYTGTLRNKNLPGRAPEGVKVAATGP
jgi:cytochrome c oxidase cbb3-type subunit 3